MLTEILMTRCCHDLAGATGALGNTLQLMEMDASFATEGIDFLKKAAATLTARLQFFRALAGTNGKVTPDVAPAYLKTLSMPFTLNGTPKTQTDLAFVLMGSEVLIKGGTIVLNTNEMTVTGDKILFPADKHRLLTADTVSESDYTPANAAPLWARHLLNGQPVTVTTAPNKLVFRW